MCSQLYSVHLKTFIKGLTFMLSILILFGGFFFRFQATIKRHKVTNRETAKKRTALLGEGSYPQGQVLRPIICNVFICDLGIKNNCALIKSADDTKLGTAINTEKHQNIIQEELYDLENWSGKKDNVVSSTRSCSQGLRRRMTAINWKYNRCK